MLKVLLKQAQVLEMSELELDPIAGSFSEISTANGKITLYVSEKANVVN